MIASNPNLRETMLRLARLFDRLADTAEKHEHMIRDAAALPDLRNSTLCALLQTKDGDQG